MKATKYSEETGAKEKGKEKNNVKYTNGITSVSENVII